MRILIVSLLFLSGALSASEINLVTGQGYVVPSGKVWVIKSPPVAECSVCTADVYIKGEASNVEVAGVTFHGNFDFSFSSDTQNEIKLYPGTELWLGDSRRELLINELPL